MTLQKYHKELSDIFRRHQYNIFEDIIWHNYMGSLFMQKKHPFQIGNKKTFQKNLPPHVDLPEGHPPHVEQSPTHSEQWQGQHLVWQEKKTGKLSVPKMGETLAQASAPLETVRGVFFFFFEVKCGEGQNITTFLSFLSLFGMFSVDNCSFECVSYRFCFDPRYA